MNQQHSEVSLVLEELRQIEKDRIAQEKINIINRAIQIRQKKLIQEENKIERKNEYISKQREELNLCFKKYKEAKRDLYDISMQRDIYREHAIQMSKRRVFQPILFSLFFLTFLFLSLTISSLRQSNLMLKEKMNKSSQAAITFTNEIKAQERKIEKLKLQVFFLEKRNKRNKLNFSYLLRDTVSLSRKYKKCILKSGKLSSQYSRCIGVKRRCFKLKSSRRRKEKFIKKCKSNDPLGCLY